MVTVITDMVADDGFTPNGDGLEDYWEIDGSEHFPDITVEVVNRWGERVFQSKGYSDGRRWDGTRNGKQLPAGTYYYIITFNKGEFDPITGPVTIIR